MFLLVFAAHIQALVIKADELVFFDPQTVKQTFVLRRPTGNKEGEERQGFGGPLFEGTTLQQCRHGYTYARIRIFFTQQLFVMMCCFICLTDCLLLVYSYCLLNWVLQSPCDDSSEQKQLYHNISSSKLLLNGRMGQKNQISEYCSLEMFRIFVGWYRTGISNGNLMTSKLVNKKILEQVDQWWYQKMT